MHEFIEIQKYSWVFDAITITVLLLVIRFFWRYSARKVYVLFLLPFVFLALYFMSECLVTKIDTDGIHYRMLPTQFEVNNIGWDQMNYLKFSKTIYYSYKTASYDVYSISDSFGLYIYLLSGKKIIIGTNKPHEMLTIINELGQNGKLNALPVYPSLR